MVLVWNLVKDLALVPIQVKVSVKHLEQARCNWQTLPPEPKEKRLDMIPDNLAPSYASGQAYVPLDYANSSPVSLYRQRVELDMSSAIA
jgi:hypothetical protein